jgi:5-methylcytosine-specific restriction endonuclease McrA
MTKLCKACGIAFPATTEFFYAHPDARDGLKSECRPCYNARYRSVYAANREKEIARRRAYIAAHREEINAKNRLYWQERPGLSTEQTRKYREAHPGYFSERSRAWQQANPECHATNQRARRARQRQAEGHHSADDIRAIYNEQDGLCFWCGCEVGATYHVDHLMPLVLGGTNSPENLAITCPSCNIAKGAKHPLVFLEEVLQ